LNIWLDFLNSYGLDHLSLIFPLGQVTPKPLYPMAMIKL
jgi:hypothetical protein